MKRDLHVCVSVLNELKSQIQAGCCDDDDAEEGLDRLRSELCLPVQTDDRDRAAALQLAPLAQCTYCDEEWLRQGIYLPLSSDRQHLSCDVSLEVRGAIIRTVLFCIVY